jgi:WD40 repeat protein
VFAAESGQALLFEDNPLRLSAQAELCRGPLKTVQFIAGRHELAYACRAGAVGLWDPKRGVVTVRAQLDGSADELVTSAAGDYLFATGGNGSIMVIDLQSDLVTAYNGHGTRVISLTPPSVQHPFLITGDVHGGIRMWPMPPRVARVIATTSSQFQSAIRIVDTTLATTWVNALTATSPAGAQDLAPHEIFNAVLERADSDGVFAAYGLTDLVEVWSSAPLQRARGIATGHGSVTQLTFVTGSHDFVTAGNDGRLIRWTPTGDHTVLAQMRQPIDRFASLLGGDAAVFSTTDGALWRTTADHRVVAIRAAGSRSSRLLAVPTLHIVYVGFADGEVIAIDTQSWQSWTILRAGGAIQAIEVTPDTQSLAVASNDGVIHVALARLAGVVAWTELSARVHHG